MPDPLTELFQPDSLALGVIMILAGTLALSLATRGILAFLRKRMDGSELSWNTAFLNALASPLRLMIWVIGIGLACETAVVGLDTPIAGVIVAARDLGAIAVITWFLVRFIHHVQQNLIGGKTGEGEEADRFAVASVGKLLRLTVFIIASLVAMQTLGISIAGVLTFGGIGGIAVGFAARDMLSNLFGGLTIYLDRPFFTGDWIRSPDKQIEGVVEEIGWRITLIRTLESRALYVPNSTFSTISIENITRMKNRRIYETIGIRYDDAVAMNDIVAEVKTYLESHDEIDQDQTLMVSFTTFAPSSLDFFIYCFTKTRNGKEYFRIKQEVMLAILRIIEDNNAQCAFPTTTLHLKTEQQVSSSTPSPA